ncbi:MAG: hypothetical protein ACXADY_15175 [Candidatus Hodarchaeales archaeon]
MMTAAATVHNIPIFIGSIDVLSIESTNNIRNTVVGMILNLDR